MQFSIRQGMLDLKKQINDLKNEALLGAPVHIKVRLLKQKRRLYLKQRGRCCLCDRPMYACFSTAPIGHAAATIEHIIPRSQRSGNHVGPNKAISCARCNKIRGVIDFNKFRQIALAVPFEALPIVIRSPKARIQYGVEL